MPQAVLEIVASHPGFETLPLTIHQKSSRLSALILLTLLVPALCALFVPVALVAAFGVPALAIAADNPLAAAQVVLGLATMTALFAVPAKRLIERFGSARSVRIEGDIVNVIDSGAFATRAWAAPLGEFSGIAHHVRATLSGLRHELILVHPVRGRSVLLHTGDHMTRALLERATTLLRLPEVPASELYRTGRPASPAPQIGLPAPILEAQAA